MCHLRSESLDRVLKVEFLITKSITDYKIRILSQITSLPALN